MTPNSLLIDDTEISARKVTLNLNSVIFSIKGESKANTPELVFESDFDTEISIQTTLKSSLTVVSHGSLKIIIPDNTISVNFIIEETLPVIDPVSRLIEFDSSQDDITELNIAGNIDIIDEVPFKF